MKTPTMINLWFIFFPVLAQASWQIAHHHLQTPTPGEPFFYTRMPELKPLTVPIIHRPCSHSSLPHLSPVMHNPTFIPLYYKKSTPAYYAKKPMLPHRQLIIQPMRFNPSPTYFSIHINGSIKQNLERIMHRYRWKIIWKSPYDYHFNGRISGIQLPHIVETLLRPFPLQGVMYQANRTMIVIPRVKL